MADAEINYTAFEFNGSPSQLGFWLIIFAASTILVFPLPFCLVGLLKWLLTSVDASDGTSLSFEGTPREIRLICWLSGISFYLLVFGTYFLSIYTAGPGAIALWIILLIGIEAVLSWHGIRWFISRIHMRGDIVLDFEGELIGYVRWVGLLITALATVIGWPWVICSLFRWICDNTYVQGDREVVFLGTGSDLLLRSCLTLAISLPVITIPTALRYLIGWWVRNLGVVDSV